MILKPRLNTETAAIERRVSGECKYQDGAMVLGGVAVGRSRDLKIRDGADRVRNVKTHGPFYKANQPSSEKAAATGAPVSCR